MNFLTVQSSLVLVIFSYTISKLVTELTGGERNKGQRNTSQRLDDPPETSSENNSWETQKISVYENPEVLPQISENYELSSSILTDKPRFNLIEPEKIIILP